MIINLIFRIVLLEQLPKVRLCKLAELDRCIIGQVRSFTSAGLQLPELHIALILIHTEHAAGFTAADALMLSSFQPVLMITQVFVRSSSVRFYVDNISVKAL